MGDEQALSRLAAEIERLHTAVKIPHTQTYRIPSILDLPSVPDIGSRTHEFEHSYESAREFLDRIEKTVLTWRRQLPVDAQPVIRALTSGGSVIVREIAEQGHNAIAIRGTADGADCLLLVHQASLQLLCTIEKVEDEKQRYKIGFRVGGERREA